MQAFCNAIQRPIIFTNEARAEIFLAGVLEDAEVASNEATGWYRLASYRDYPNVRGMQRVDETAANAMIQDFAGAVSRIKRFFGGHAPAVYRGHPDDGTYDEHDDTTVYGNVDAMEARTDGIYAHITWAPEFANIRGKEAWRLSPRWAMKTVSNGLYRPVRLVSIGLTTEPQLVDAPFANSNKNTTMTLLKAILAKLGFAPERIAATETGADGAIKPEEADAAIAKLVEASKNEADKAKTDIAAINSRVTTLEAEKAAALATASNERRARAMLTVDAAVAKGAITGAQRSEWEGKLTSAADFVLAANELSTQKPALHTESQFGDQGARRTDPQVTASNEMKRKVSTRMKETGEEWGTAWSNVATTEEGKRLLESMSQKA
ncbi:MAG: hypothetical protein WC378_11845 [Opitutaceae bacterium]